MNKNRKKKILNKKKLKIKIKLIQKNNLLIKNNILKFFNFNKLKIFLLKQQLQYLKCTN